MLNFEIKTDKNQYDNTIKTSSDKLRTASFLIKNKSTRNSIFTIWADLKVSVNSLSLNVLIIKRIWLKETTSRSSFLDSYLISSSR